MKKEQEKLASKLKRQRTPFEIKSMNLGVAKQEKLKFIQSFEDNL